MTEHQPTAPRPLRQRLAATPLWQKLTGGALALALLAVAALLTWDAVHDTQDEIAARCRPALMDRAPGDTSRPAACDGLTPDNYDLLVISTAMDGLGWTDEDGFDVERMLDDVAP